jgi:ADP-ribose pyrophosphatase
MSSVTINHIEDIYSGRVFKMVRENITLDNQVTVDIDLIRHPGASAIVPISGNKVILIRQYRHAVGGYIWEIPAGTLNPGEPILECANRELIEETGYTAQTWEKIGEITPVPGYSDERIHIFLAADLRPAAQNLDKDEVLEVHPMELNQAMSMIVNGQIQDAKTICGLMLARQRLIQNS